MRGFAVAHNTVLIGACGRLPSSEGEPVKRRQFVTLFVSAAIAWPLAAHGQQLSTPVRRIAVLLRVAKDDPDAQRDLQAFRDGLETLGGQPVKYSSNIATRAPIPPIWMPVRQN